MKTFHSLPPNIQDATLAFIAKYPELAHEALENLYQKIELQEMPEPKTVAKQIAQKEREIVMNTALNSPI